MKQTIEIQAVDLVRRIRDAQAEELADKSVAEVMEFFNRATSHARGRSEALQAVPKSTGASNKRMQPTRQRRARG
jgi:RIO-like serine/threonine protein kinase